MIQKLTMPVLAGLLGMALSATAAHAGHHEVDETPPKVEHDDHGKHKGHDMAPGHGKAKGKEPAHEGHGEHGKDHQPPAEDKK